MRLRPRDHLMPETNRQHTQQEQIRRPTVRSSINPAHGPRLPLPPRSLTALLKTASTAREIFSCRVRSAETAAALCVSSEYDAERTSRMASACKAGGNAGCGKRTERTDGGWSVFAPVGRERDSRFKAAITTRPSSLLTIPCPTLPANEPTNASSPAPRIRFLPFFPARPASSAWTTGFCCISGVT